MKENILEKLLDRALEKELGDKSEAMSGIKIVVLQRGWVVIGRYEQDGEYGVLTDAYVIRKWGTSAGLGQLALQGKQADTILDKTGTVRFHGLTTVAVIDANEKVWKNEL